MGDISLMPESLRGREEQVKTQESPSSVQDEGRLKMHVPDAMVDEDIEIIEVDEGDLAAVLSEEPFMTRLTYKLSLLIDQLKGKMSKDGEAPPAKAPPQFFKPPKKGLITSSQAVIQQIGVSTSASAMAAAASVAASREDAASPRADHRGGSVRARITPQTEIPRRVRVIKRVRKPVRVSLISAEDLAVLTIDVGRRKWTLVIFIVLFSALIAGGYFLISSRVKISNEHLAVVQGEVSSIRSEADEKLGQWKQYEDLEGRIKLLQGALDSHIMITRLFDFLEQNTLKGVSYKTASWSGSGQLSLDVVAKSFDDTGGQLIVMKRSPYVEDAESSGFTMTRDAETGDIQDIAFQMALKLKKDSFVGSGLIVDSSVTSTSSTQAEVSLAP